MKIEKEIIRFRPDVEKHVQMSSLQKQYYSELKLNLSIYDLVSQAADRGWLINFKELYGLVFNCFSQKLIETVSINNYFEDLANGDLLLKTKFSANMNASKPTVHSAKGIASQTHLASIGQSSTTGENGLTESVKKKLRTTSFFRSMNSAIFDELIENAEIIEFRPEETICEENQDGRDLYCLLSGQVGVYKQVNGRNRFVSLLNEGTVFGETAFFLGQKRTATLVVLKKSEVVKIQFRSEFMSHTVNQSKAQNIIERFWVQHALINSEIFKDLPADCFDSLVSVGEIRKFKNQETIFLQNEIGDRAFCVIQGNLAVIKDDKNIQTLKQGSFFGEIALIVSGGRRTASVICTSDVVLLEISQTRFYQLLAANLFLAKEIQSIAEDRIRRDLQSKVG